VLKRKIFPVVRLTFGLIELGPLRDVVLLNTPGGRERTEPEYRVLFQKAGFQFKRAISAKVDNWILEVQKA
jgi:hypothetical protein